MVLFFQFEVKMTVCTVRKKKICEANNFLMLFYEELISFWYFFKKSQLGKPFPGDLEG